MVIHPDIEMLILSVLGGLFATLIMTLTEVPSWRRWGLHGVLEWHENQVLSVKLFRLSESNLHLKGIFFFHFLNGGLGGIGFFILLRIFPFTISNLFLSGIVYGIFLWVVTLIPIHKPITGISPFRHPNGITPAIASLIGHLVYGFIIGYFFTNLPA